MITPLYMAMSALIIFWLSMKVIKIRWKDKVSVGHEGNKQLEVAMAAQSNAIEYIPITLLLLLGLEMNGVDDWVVHIFGVILVAGRLLHAHSFLGGNLKGRILSMRMTFYNLGVLAVVNILYLPYWQLTK